MVPQGGALPANGGNCTVGLRDPMDGSFAPRLVTQVCSKEAASRTLSGYWEPKVSSSPDRAG